MAAAVPTDQSPDRGARRPENTSSPTAAPAAPEAMATQMAKDSRATGLVSRRTDRSLSSGRGWPSGTLVTDGRPVAVAEVALKSVTLTMVARGAHHGPMSNASWTDTWNDPLPF
ncbi:hypothetical protein GCM10010977_07920 [Citricoccus zhacaiensis]|uniref:Uncharacterized protein n=1 Tax=Citricoccus zhacaiensis TaxID=489142 RepID=A0ABQ2LUA6_9MICC|nr:hypothetical protein GCM10010977_07920 [Citricoccus zhacaiensis]